MAGESVVGVLLAAGTGSRFGDANKLLAPVADGGEAGFSGDETVVHRSARHLVAAPVVAAAAVVGFEADRVADALADLPIERVDNPQFEAGQATSLAAGVDWARERDADACLFALGDMPWVRYHTYRALVERWRVADADIVVPEYRGQRGNPVVFGASHFDALADVDGDVGGRELFETDPVDRVAVDDSGVRRDVDTPDDVGV